MQKSLILTDWLSGLSKALPAEGMVGFLAVERGLPGRNEAGADIHKDTAGCGFFLKQGQGGSGGITSQEPATSFSAVMPTRNPGPV